MRSATASTASWRAWPIASSRCPDRLLLYTDDGERALEQVNQRQIPIESALVRRSSLEDVFLRLTGRSLVE